jgi:hypothetical protein
MPDEPHAATPIEVDAVLPPDGKSTAKGKIDPAHASEVSRIIAHWMDEFIHVPGTKIRFGLDPLIALVPGFGALLSSSVSAVVLAEAVRLRVPVSVLFRMGINVLINDAIDCIPLVGNAISVIFKSNTINLALINRWKAGEHAKIKKGSRLFLLLVFGFWIGMMAFWWFVILTVLGTALHFLGKLF